MVLIQLDGNSEIGAPVRSYLSYLTCLIRCKICCIRSTTHVSNIGSHSEMGAHGRRDLGYLIFLRHFFRLRAVTNLLENLGGGGNQIASKFLYSLNAISNKMDI